eukprot:TRINITY_DN585_c0_g2_i2.p1 TRINITY_DN585_c0_g2~~TRINITY_DN585_c0_g2_i2.p1  ORF type:complete len:424 (-),score=38.19 TRINITY_DN585_c0_g2_i2:1118-2389(-)
MNVFLLLTSVYCSQRMSLNRCNDKYVGEKEFFGTGSELQSIDNIINPSYSKSTLANMERSERLLLEFAKKHNAGDPVTVSIKSTELIMNLLVEKCRYNSENAMTVDTMCGYVQGLRLVYNKYGHRGTWICDVKQQSAIGNPLVRNPDFEQFRRAYRVNLARYGNIKHRARPITAEMLCDHAENYWFGSSQMEIMDIVFHSVCVLGLNLGLRYDEVSKLRMENVSIGRQSATLTSKTAIKNSTVERVYELAEWDGNTALHFSLYMDPFVALLSWVVARGNDNGFLFPDVVGTMTGTSLVFGKPLSCKKFTSFMRSRLLLIGIGSEDVVAFSGNSLKRGSVQPRRSLGHMDEFIMRKLGMVGANAYANYCAAYNSYAPRELPRFHSWEHMVKHAEAIAGEARWIEDPTAFDEFEREVFGESSMSI